MLAQRILDKVAEDVEQSVKQPKELIQIIVTWQDKQYYEANIAQNYDKLQYKTSYTNYLISEWKEMMNQFGLQWNSIGNFLLQQVKNNQADSEFMQQVLRNPMVNIAFVSDAFKTNFSDKASFESLLQNIRQNASSHSFQSFPLGNSNNNPIIGGYTNQRNGNTSTNPQGYQSQEQALNGMNLQQQQQMTTTQPQQQRRTQQNGQLQQSKQQQQQQPLPPQSQLGQSQLQSQYMQQQQQQYPQQGESYSSQGVNKSSTGQSINKQKYHSKSYTLCLK